MICKYVIAFLLCKITENIRVMYYKYKCWIICNFMQHIIISMNILHGICEDKNPALLMFSNKIQNSSINLVVVR